MKKFLVRSFLALFILLLSGNGQLYAHAYWSSVHNSSSEHSQTLEQGSFDAGRNRLPSIKKFAAADRGNTFLINATEVREEEEDKHVFIFLKKNRDGSNCFTACFCALTRCYFFSYIKEVLSFSKHFSDLSSNRRHLIFQVFVI